MNSFSLRLELANNPAVSAALTAHEEVEVLLKTEGYVEVLVGGLDFGRWDSEGNAYVADLLGFPLSNILKIKR